MPPKKRSTTARGLGWQHQQQRKRLLAAHEDGTPCDLCGKPMYLWQQLDAGHGQARALGGRKADRLQHAKCNRGEGTAIAKAARQVKAPPSEPVRSREW